MYEVKLELYDGGWLLIIVKEMRISRNKKIRRRSITTEYTCKDLKSALDIIEKDFNTP